MKQRLVLHIGMHKTGSTSIQHYLSRNRRLLRLLGVDYPESRGADGRPQPKHAALFDAISHEADFGRPHPVFGSASAMVDALALRIERAGRPLAVISAEGLSGPKPEFARALKPLGKRFDTTVVIFLRRPDLWVESFHRQMVMSRQVRETRPLREFIASPDILRHLDFGAILDGWIAAFGEAAMRRRVFAPESVDWRPVDVFLKAAGAPPLCLALPHRRAHRNATTPAQLVAAVRRANAAGLSLTSWEVGELEAVPPESADRSLTEAERRDFLAAHRNATQLAHGC